MNNSRMKILEMLAEGKITADEASALLEKVNVSERSETPHGKPWNHRGMPDTPVVVDSSDGDKVNVKVPMSLIRTGIKLSALMPADAADAVKTME